MALRLGPITLPFGGKDHADDPYWDHYINRAPNDIANTVNDMLLNAPEGVIFPTKADLHTPEITSDHLKQLATYLGADLIGITKLEPSDNPDGEDFPFAVVCAVQAEHDPRTAKGIGGQVPVTNGLFVTFVLSAYMRELGYRATADYHPEADRLAAKAGLGTVNAEGRLTTPTYGTAVHVAKVIRTDLPLAADR
jgi:hypothetical protein